MRRTLAVAFAAFVLFAPQAISAQSVSDFHTELQERAATCGREELTAYVHSRIFQLTTDVRAVEDGVLLGDGVLLSDAAITLDGVLLGDRVLSGNGDSDLFPQLFCVGWSCLERFEGDLAATTEASFLMLSNCEGPGSSAFLICAANTLASHSTAITAAHDDLVACHSTVHD